MTTVNTNAIQATIVVGGKVVKVNQAFEAIKFLGEAQCKSLIKEFNNVFPWIFNPNSEHSFSKFDRELAKEIVELDFMLEEDNSPDTWVDDVFLAPNGTYERTWLDR